MSTLFDDPLSMFAAEQQPVVAKAPVPTLSTPTPAAPEGDMVFRQVDASKVVFKEKKAPKPSSSESFGAAHTAIAPEVTESTKGLGFGVSLWENAPAPSKTFDILAEVQQQSSSSSSSEDGEGLFSSTARAPKPVVLAPSSSSSSSSTSSSGSSSSSSTSRVRVGGVKDDSKLDDLQTSTAFLERENDDELDYGLFGKSNAAAASQKSAAVSSAATSSNSSNKPPPLKARKDDFELESADVLDKMEALTLAKEKEPSVMAPVAAPSSAAAKPAADIDMSALDLDSYIAQQSSNTGGGLFD